MQQASPDAVAYGARTTRKEISLLARSLYPRRRGFLLAALVCALYLDSGLPVAAAAAPPGIPVDPSLPDYVPHQHVAGSVVGHTGMDTVEQMMGAWNAAFRKFQPGADFPVVQKDG